jgi:hypothetical protein
MCMNALRGTGIEAVEELLLEAAPPALELLELLEELRELTPGELALWEAADPPALASTLDPAAPKAAEVRLPPETFEEPPTARFNTGCTEASEEPLRLEAADSLALPEEAVPPAPAPDEDPAVFDAIAVVVPPCDDWMYRSYRLPGLCWNLGSASRMTWYWLTCVYRVLTCR